MLVCKQMLEVLSRLCQKVASSFRPQYQRHLHAKRHHCDKLGEIKPAISSEN